MDFNKLTIKSQEAIAAAQELARRRGNPEIYPEHLLLALLDQELFADWQGLRAEAEQKLASRPTATGPTNNQPRVSNALRERARRTPTRERAQLEDDYVSTEHLFLALEPVPREEILAWIKKVRGGQRVTSQDPEGSYQALAKFGRDLTEAAEQGKLDPVIGRDEEIRRVIQILSRPHEEQPRADRRARRRQDRDRRRARPADRRRRRARGAEGPARLVARHRRAARRLEVPRRVRGAAEGGADRDQVERRPA